MGINTITEKEQLKNLHAIMIFFCDDTNIYMKSPKNPFKQLGNLLLSTHLHLVGLSNNTELDGISEKFTKYGNGIEFWIDATNIRIENNIIRNCYDAGFTLQGDLGKWKNIVVKNNIFIKNCFSIELWGSEKSEGMSNVHILDNMCINEGKRMGTKSKT